MSSFPVTNPSTTAQLCFVRKCGPGELHPAKKSSGSAQWSLKSELMFSERCNFLRGGRGTRFRELPGKLLTFARTVSSILLARSHIAGKHAKTILYVALCSAIIIGGFFCFKRLLTIVINWSVIGGN